MNEKAEILRTIDIHKDDIITNIEEESIDVYRFLMNEFSKGEVNKNYLFQFVYRSFYRIDNAGLSPEFKREYFRIMDRVRNKNEMDVDEIVNPLYMIPTLRGYNSIQFSFATKMMNTIQSKYPIFDSEVVRVFGFANTYIKDYNLKMKRYKEQYACITDMYNEILDLGLINQVLERFDSRFGSSGIADIKKLDFIFWSCGKILKSLDKKPQ